MEPSEGVGVRLAAGGSTLVLVCLLWVGCAGPESSDLPNGPPSTGIRPLPAPDRDGPRSLEAAIEARRSVRDLDPRPLTDAEVGQLL